MGLHLHIHSFPRRKRRHNPVPIRGHAALRRKLRARTHHYLVGGHVLAKHEIRLGSAPYAESLALPNGISNGALMLAKHLTLSIDDIARLVRRAAVALQKAQIVAIGHEADILAIVLLRIDETLLFGDFAHMGFCETAKRQKRMRQLVLSHKGEHVALIFRGIEAAPQRKTNAIACGHIIARPQIGAIVDARDARRVLLRTFNSSVMTGGNEIATQFLSAPQKPAEFHAAVAFDARIGSMSNFVFFHERTHDFVFELSRIIEHVMRDSQTERNVARILDVIEAAARMAIVVNGIVVVQLHGSADALIALALQQIRRYARIDAAAHRNKHASLRFRHVHPFHRFHPTVFG